MVHSVPPKKVFNADDMQLVGTGQRLDTADAHGQMPPKVKGEHRWVVTTAYVVRDPEAVISHSVILDTENLLFAVLGCIDCETEYGQVKDKPCPVVEDTWG